MAIILCFIPIIIAVILFTSAFKLKLTHQLLACLFGLIAVLPISFIQYYIPEFLSMKSFPVLYSILKSLILYGLIEELIKMVLLLPLPKKDYDAFHFLLLSFVMGITLGCFESSVYYFDHLQIANARGAQLLYTQIFARILTADIIHMCCTGICGLFIFTVRQKKLNNSEKSTARPSFLVIAIIIHGLYDFFAGFQNGLRWFSIAVVLLAIAQCRICYTDLSEND